jgi:hypothetical protein
MSVPCKREWAEVWLALRDLIDRMVAFGIYEHECNMHKSRISCELYKREGEKFKGLADIFDEKVKALLSCLKER